MQTATPEKPAVLPPIEEVKEFILSEPQYAVFSARRSRVLNMAGQGSGKSALIGILTGAFAIKFPHIKGFVAANTYMQLTQSTLSAITKLWASWYGLQRYDPASKKGDYVIDCQPPKGFTRLYEFKSYNNIISFRNGHVIFVGSLDNYLAHDGKEFAYAHLDETKDTKETALKSVILARLREAGIWYNTADPEPTTNLLYGKTKEEAIANAKAEGLEVLAENLQPFNPCYIHTSPAEGTVEWLTTMFKLEEVEKEILVKIQSETDYYYNEEANRAVCIYSTYHNRRNLPENYISDRLADLTSAQALKFVFGYPFSKTGGEYFTQFDRLTHIQPCPLIKGAPFHITLDFNVLPYMTLLCAQIEETAIEFRIRFFKEYCLSSPKNSTEAVCEELILDYQDDILDLFYYGDASGKSRVAGFGDDMTNFNTLREKLEYFITDASNRVSKKNAGVLKRRSFIERILAGKVWLGTKRVVIVIDPACKELIKDMQYLMLGKDGKLKELATNAEGASYQKLGHTSDAAEYLVCELLSDLM